MKRPAMVVLWILLLCPSAHAFSYVFNENERSIYGLEADGYLFDVSFISGSLQYVPGVGWVSQQISMAPEFGAFDMQEYGSSILWGVIDVLRTYYATTDEWALPPPYFVGDARINIYDTALGLWDFMPVEYYHAGAYQSDHFGLDFIRHYPFGAEPDPSRIRTETIAIVKPVAPVPEPTTIILFGVGLFGLIGKRKLSKSKST